MLEIGTALGADVLGLCILPAAAGQDIAAPVLADSSTRSARAQA